MRLHYAEAGEGPLIVAHSRQFLRGLHHPGQLRKSWYVFFFDLPELPGAVVHANHWHFFRHFLRDATPLTPRRRPNATSRRGHSQARRPG